MTDPAAGRSEDRYGYELEWFDREGDRLVGRAPLRGVTIWELKRLVGAPADGEPWLRGDYRVESDAALVRLAAAAGHAADPVRYAYFVAGFSLPGGPPAAPPAEAPP